MSVKLKNKYFYKLFTCMSFIFMYIGGMKKQIDIRKFRKSKGWNQAELAKRLGTNIMTISRWERGKVPTTKSSAWFALENLIAMEPAE